MLPIPLFIHDSLTRLQQSNMIRLLRLRLEAAETFTIRHWPKMMLVVINLPMIPFWYNLLSNGQSLLTSWQELKEAIGTDPHANDPAFQHLISIGSKFIGVLISFLILTGADLVLDIYVLLTNSVRAAKLRRAIFWTWNSIFMIGEIVVHLGRFSAVGIFWWFTQMTNLFQTDNMSPEELMLARQEYETNFTSMLAEEANTLAIAYSGLSWAGVFRQWAWDTWKNSWVQGAVIGWVLHVLIMDLQGEPRTWWGGRLQREQRDEENVMYTPDEKKASERETD